ncbi:MAG: hypothetical protein AAF291_16700 [Pseudomonadota bacterium]
MNRLAYSAAPFALVCAACSPQADDRAELTSADTDGEAAALAASIEAGDFDTLELGAKIVGPRGPEVKAALSNEEAIMADITSYVACPAGMEECNPKTAPEDTLYTFVHTVYPGEDNDADTGAGKGADDANIENAESFMMTGPAHGFTGVAGFSKASAVAAAGDSVEVVITCGEEGGLIWTVNAGEGGNQWEDAEPITFYWQSTQPPAGPATRYAIRANGVTGTGDGPYPAEDAVASNACLLPDGE